MITIDKNGHMLLKRKGGIPRELRIQHANVSTGRSYIRHVFVSQKMIRLPLDHGANSLAAQGLYNSREKDPCILCGKSWDDPHGSAHEIGPGWPERSNEARVFLKLELDFDYEIVIEVRHHERAHPDVPSLDPIALAEIIVEGAKVAANLHGDQNITFEVNRRRTRLV